MPAQKNSLGPEFYTRLVEVANNLGMKPEDILVVMAGESGLGAGTSNSGANAYNSDGHGSGLVGFMPDTLRGLGFASKEESGKSISDRFRALGEVKQLDYVEKLISNQQKMCGFKFTNATQYYICNFVPVSLSYPGMKEGDPSAVIVEKNPTVQKSKAVSIELEKLFYKSNAPLDVDHDGKITYGDMDKRVQNIKNSGNYKNLIKDMQESINYKPDMSPAPEKQDNSFVSLLENKIKEITNSLPKLASSNILIKINSNNTINSIEYANILSDLLNKHLHSKSDVCIDSSTIHVSCSFNDNNNLVKNAYIVCDSLNKKFNELYNINIDYTILSNRYSTVAPINYKKASINNRKFKLLHASKNG